MTLCGKASVTVTVMGKEPVLVGVPESTPALESVNPGGSGPVSVHVCAPIPPNAENVKLYGRFRAPAGGAGVEFILRELSITMVYLALPCAGGEAESFTVTTTL